MVNGSINILKIPDSKEVWKQRKMEEMRDAMMEIINHRSSCSRWYSSRCRSLCQRNRRHRHRRLLIMLPCRPRPKALT